MSIDFNKLPDNRNRERIVRDLREEFEDLEIVSAASSVCKRDIYQINIGDTTNNPVLFVGAFHGMEWLTSLVLFRFVESLCTSMRKRKNLRGIDVYETLSKRGLIVVPCLNPDGVEISIHGSHSACRYKDLVSSVSLDDTSKWQANARGVDLNHNFNANWENLHMLERSKGIGGPAATQYGGPYPESEPETQYLVSLVCSNNFRHVIAFHSQGQEIYWNFGDETPAKSKYLADIMSASSGYKVSEPEGLAVGGGFKDWFIKKFLRPGFTVEIGKGQNPLPLSDLDPIYNRIEEMLVLAAVL